jgi:hypothetical protein
MADGARGGIYGLSSAPASLIYILGKTYDELGGSKYYAHCTGPDRPERTQVNAPAAKKY